ncbi:hypothetical protein QBC42DRAFT_179435 [Cladorrhinum samala]|uniref:HMG box domain-containing protein n=1 Tax=Cladorrhinum samala TaxID=585594 RepID=A0AAV9HN99_9PEZI|nr:hypothetical protein QBC42DRAFT_179435 [Cladorrhinum samala]
MQASARSGVIIPSGFRLACAFQQGCAQARTATTKATATKPTATKATATKTTATKSNTTKTAAKPTAKTTAKTKAPPKAATSKASSSKPSAKAAPTKAVKAKTPAAARREQAAITARARKEKAAIAAKEKKLKAAAAQKAKKAAAAAAAKARKDTAAAAKKEKAALAREKKKIALAARREKAAAIAARRKEKKAAALAKKKERAALARERKAAAVAKRKAREKSPNYQKKVRNQKIAELRGKALLEEAHKAPISAWSLYATNNLSSMIKDYKAKGQGLKDVFTDLSAQFKALSPEEQEALNLQARQNKLANEASYKAWVATHSPLAIKEANKARTALKHLGVKSKPPIHDPRQPKFPHTSYILFFQERLKGGHYENLPSKVAATTCAAEWRSMSEAAKKPYADAAKLDLERYRRESEALYGTAAV